MALLLSLVDGSAGACPRFPLTARTDGPFSTPSLRGGRRPTRQSMRTRLWPPAVEGDRDEATRAHGNATRVPLAPLYGSPRTLRVLAMTTVEVHQEEGEARPALSRRGEAHPRQRAEDRIRGLHLHLPVRPHINPIGATA